MIHVIMGLKGSGKTKKMIDAINSAVANANGDVVLFMIFSEMLIGMTQQEDKLVFS